MAIMRPSSRTSEYMKVLLIVMLMTMLLLPTALLWHEARHGASWKETVGTRYLRFPYPSAKTFEASLMRQDESKRELPLDPLGPRMGVMQND